MIAPGFHQNMMRCIIKQGRKGWTCVTLLLRAVKSSVSTGDPYKALFQAEACWAGAPKNNVTRLLLFLCSLSFLITFSYQPSFRIHCFYAPCILFPMKICQWERIWKLLRWKWLLLNILTHPDWHSFERKCRTLGWRKSACIFRLFIINGMRDNLES